MKLLHAALAAMLLSGCATAQGMPGMGGHDMGGGGGMGGGGMGGAMGSHHGGAQICHFVGSGHHMEGTLAFLKAELKISAPQSAAWDAFAAAFASARPDSHGGMNHKGGKHGEGKDDDAGSLADRMAHHEHMMEMHLSQMKKMHATIGALYATLGEHEKHLADELIPAFMMCRMHG